MATFGLKYYGEFRSKYQHILWRAEIAQRGYIGTSEEMTFCGTAPIKVTWEQRGDDFYTPVKASEASITILCKDNFHYLGLFTSDPREYRLTLYRNGYCFWQGFVVADLYSEKFAPPPYEVTVKAVDGFNILSGIDFTDALGQTTSGKKSLHWLLSECLAILELDLPIVQWVDLLPEGIETADGVTPLECVYLDIERLLYVYEEPTYREILELCLAPFGAQVFQSGGAIHIRRVVSLFEDTRPEEFESLVKDRAKVWRYIDTDETRGTKYSGLRMVSVDIDRVLQNDMWDGGLYMIGENTTLDIVPAVRNITVAVRNRELGNLAGQLGFLNPDMWKNPEVGLTFGDDGSVTLKGDSSQYDTEIITTGCEVKQCNFDLIWEFTAKTKYSNYSSSGGSGSTSSTERRTNTHTTTMEYGVKLVTSDGTTYWLDTDGGWNTEETVLSVSVTTGNEASVKIEIGGIPADGTWYFFINQTLTGSTSVVGRNYYYAYEYMIISGMTLSIDADDEYENGLSYKSLINPANNVDIDIELPVSDIPSIPNDILLYSLYFTDSNGTPTRLWHTVGRDDYASLVDHMAMAVLKMRQLPSKRLAGEIFTSRHLDLNSLVVDEKYLGAGFYVNSLETDALGDSYDAELVEMPRLVNPDTPIDGNDCVTAVLFGDKEAESCIRCLDFIMIKTTDHCLYRFDAVTRQAVLLYSSDNDFTLFEAENGYVRYEDGTAYYCDYRGTVKRQYTPEDGRFGGFITYREGQFWMLRKTEFTTTSGEKSHYYLLVRPEVKTTYTRTAGSSRGQTVVYMYGDYISAVVTTNQIVINTNTAVYMYDNRYHTAPNVMKVSEADQIFGVNDDYYVMGDSSDDVTYLFKRTSITESEKVGKIARWGTYAEIVANRIVLTYEATTIYRINEQTSYYIRNTESEGYLVRSFIIFGDIYIVCTDGVFKFVKAVSKT